MKGYDSWKTYDAEGEAAAILAGRITAEVERRLNKPATKAEWEDFQCEEDITSELMAIVLASNELERKAAQKALQNAFEGWREEYLDRIVSDELDG